MLAISKNTLSPRNLFHLRAIRSLSITSEFPCRFLSTSHKPRSSASSATTHNISSNVDLSQQTFKQPNHAEVKTTTTCDINSFTNRSHSCGQIDDSLVGREVTLCGWIDYQRGGKFIVLRDCYGSVQLFIKNKEQQEIVKKLYLESVIQVKGKVNHRPVKDINPKLANGNIEVCVEEFTVLNASMQNLPFKFRDLDVNEQTRLTYRYLDLRHPRLNKNLRLRSKFITSLRNCLVDQFGFVEIETPTLFKATPGGAQEFIVPTRFPNHFYSLVQSPQQFKQLLMVGGIDRYFQVARCYRDEGTKSDRQPEFTQLDIEMSFTSIDHVIELIENLLHKCWPIANEISQISTPFYRMDYHTAMEKYGVDKPDLRSDIEIKPLPIENASSDQEHYILVIPQEYDESFAIKSFINEDLSVQINTLNYKGQLNYFKWSSVPFQQNLSETITQKLKRDFTFKDNDFLWIASGERADCLRILGRIRAYCIDKIEEQRINSGHPRKLSFLWVDNFPLFLADETGKLESSHHPFTAPKAPHIDLIYSDPAKVIGQNFDLVINGREIGGGSIRIIDPKLQRYVLGDILKCDTSSMEYFIDALKAGCPPHGGFAIGLDRLIALICQEPLIRDVIAFPKSAHGKDLMSNAPCPVDGELRKLYHLKPQ